MVHRLGPSALLSVEEADRNERAGVRLGISWASGSANFKFSQSPSSTGLGCIVRFSRAPLEALFPTVDHVNIAIKPRFSKWGPGTPRGL